ncbi:MAG: hypothetical protein ACR2LK_09675 [Solirubrobacteraceae bacterium]
MSDELVDPMYAFLPAADVNQPSAVQLRAIRDGRAATGQQDLPLPATTSEARVILRELHAAGIVSAPRSVAGRRGGPGRGTVSLEQRIRDREREIIERFKNGDEAA